MIITKHRNVASLSMTEIMMELVRAAIFERIPFIPEAKFIDWSHLMDLSVEQGLLAWVWDGICKLPEDQQPPKQERINWGLSAQEIWDRYEIQRRALMNMVGVCNSNDMRLLLLKGMGLAKLFPRPQSRPSGDIDIFLFDDYEKGNQLFSKGNRHKGVKDTGFVYDGVYIENHHTLIYTNTKKRRVANNYLISNLSEVELNADGYYTLPVVSNSVYLLLHTLSHMDSEYVVSLRSIIDFGMLVYRNKTQLNENGCCVATMRKLGLIKPFCLLLRICEYYLKVSYYELIPIKIPSKDINRAILLIEKKESRYHFKDTDSFIFRWKENLRRYFQIRWLYKYIPRSIGEHIISAIRREVSTFVRRVFSIPSQKSIREGVKSVVR